MPLIKSQLVRLIASDTGLSQKKSSKMLNLLLEALTDSLAKDNNIKIAGFGKLYLRYQKERKIRHPSTGRNVIVGPKKTVKFKCFKNLRHEINYLDYDLNKFNRVNESILQQLFNLIEKTTDYEEEEESIL